MHPKKKKSLNDSYIFGFLTSTIKWGKLSYQTEYVISHKSIAAIDYNEVVQRDVNTSTNVMERHFLLKWFVDNW